MNKYAAREIGFDNPFGTQFCHSRVNGNPAFSCENRELIILSFAKVMQHYPFYCIPLTLPSPRPQHLQGRGEDKGEGV